MVSGRSARRAARRLGGDRLGVVPLPLVGGRRRRRRRRRSSRNGSPPSAYYSVSRQCTFRLDARALSSSASRVSGYFSCVPRSSHSACSPTFHCVARSYRRWINYAAPVLYRIQYRHRVHTHFSYRRGNPSTRQNGDEIVERAEFHHQSHSGSSGRGRGTGRRHQESRAVHVAVVHDRQRGQRLL